MTDSNNFDGIVYVFSNPAMPGIVKIGKTTRDSVDNRLRELFTTGVPVPFECDYACRVENCGETEKALHIAFDPYRINPKREFFKINKEQAIAILKILSKEEITNSVSEEVERSLDPIDVRSGKRLKLSNRRPPLDFHEMGIMNGEILEWYEGGKFVTVCGNKKVNYEGADISLTAITRDLLNKPYDVKPTPYWKYNGENLDDIYEQTYPIEIE